MGAGTSATSSPFDVFSEWPKEKIEQVIDEYKQKDYDFGIDAATTSMLLGVDLQVSKDIISKMSRSGTGIINALSLISGIIIMSNSIENSERFKLVFDVFDFDSSGSISMDEMTILLLSATKAIHVMTKSPAAAPSDPGMEKVTIHAFKTLELEMGAFITRDSFVSWGTDYVKVDPGELDAEAVLSILSSVGEGSTGEEEVSLSIDESAPPLAEKDEPRAELVSESQVKDESKVEQASAEPPAEDSTIEATVMEGPVATAEASLAEEEAPAAEGSIVAAEITAAKAPPKEEAAPATEESSTAAEAPVTEEAALPAAEVASAAAETPAAEEAASAAEETSVVAETPAAEEAVPAAEETSAAAETPATEEAVPAAEKSAAAAETPATEEAVPAAEETSVVAETPAAEEAVPAAEETSVVAETPAAEEAAPAAEEALRAAH